MISRITDTLIIVEFLMIKNLFLILFDFFFMIKDGALMILN